MSVAAFVAFTAFNLAAFVRAFRRDRLTIFPFAALQVIGYGMLMLSVHANHLYIVLPLLAVVAWRWRGVAVALIVASCIDLLIAAMFYGAGRDFPIPAFIMPDRVVIAASVILCAASIAGSIVAARRLWSEPCR
jgi:hypothetical protein